MVLQFSKHLRPQKNTSHTFYSEAIFTNKSSEWTSYLDLSNGKHKDKKEPTDGQNVKCFHLKKFGKEPMQWLRRRI